MKHSSRILLSLSFALFAKGVSLQAQVIAYNFNQDAPTATNSGSAASANLTYGGAANLWGADQSGVTGGAGDHAFTSNRSGATGSQSYAATAAGVAELGGIKTLTITGWLQTSQAAWGTTWMLSNYGGYDKGFSLSTNGTGNLNLSIGNTGQQTSTGGNFAKAGNLNTWVFFAITWDGNIAGGAGNQAVKFYYGDKTNAVALDSTVDRSGSGTLNASTAALTVGQITTSSDWYNAFGGNLDNLRIYSSVLDAAGVEAVRASALVPEPGTAVLLLGAGGFLIARRRRTPAA